NNPIMVDATEPAYRAAAMMKLHRIHHLPVVSDGCVVGMLSARDLIGVVPETSNRKGKPARPTRSFDSSQDIHVGDICSPTIISVPSNTGIHRAAWLMVRHNIRSLPLVRDDRIVGILTDTDLIRACLTGNQRITGIDSLKWGRSPVADHMKSSPCTIEPTASVLHAWMLMREQDVQHLAVVRHDEFVVGIVSDDDVFYALREPQSNAVTTDAHSRLPAMSLSDIMTREVITVGKYDKLNLASDKMLSNNIAALLVIDYWLEGIITRKDLLKAIIMMD
ncbi:MAG: putative signal transduction protein with domain, partial [Planctomycetaceae bacterium]|nr:putative signal transduction protein with domain [Planctomycetaceae bacterium]